MKKDVSLQFLRVISMLLIVACHIAEEIPNNLIVNLAQFLNVGVFIFLFLSGYLYSGKRIDNKKKWLFNKFIVLGIPIYIYVITISIIHVFKNSFELLDCLPYFLFLQYFYNHLLGAGHLWFITIIFACYFINIFVLTNIKENNYKKVVILLFIFSCLVSAFNQKIGMLLFYIFAFIAGYYYRIFQSKINIKEIIWYILFAIGLCIRIVAKIVFDGTFIYDCIFVSITQILLTISLFNIITGLVKKLKINNSILINYLDGLSYFVYVSHYMYMVGPVKLTNISGYLIFDLLIATIASFLSAIILKTISEYFIKKIRW